MVRLFEFNTDHVYLEIVETPEAYEFIMSDPADVLTIKMDREQVDVMVAWFRGVDV